MDNIIENLKAKDVDPALLKRLEDNYGPIDVENDFFTDNLDTYYKTVEVNKETNSSGQKIIKLASFGNSLQKMHTALKSLKQLLGKDEARNDNTIQSILVDFKEVFNKYRTHLRTSYPDQYRQIKNQLREIEIDETSTSGGAGAYQTPFAFRLKGSKPNDKAYKELGYEEVKEGIGAHLGPGPNASEDGVKDNAYVKQFKYKLVPKDKQGNYVQKGSGLEVKQLFEVESAKEFQDQRIGAFDQIEQEMNDIYKMLSNAKNETADYYNNNKSSYNVLKPTDLILDYIKDIKNLLTGK
jgi:hypothetical protein|tara:strand:+ start:6720 stop:7607 length:888 start_codon:yes stop_codon:yes gene_type:complete